MGMIWTAYRMDDAEAQRLAKQLTDGGDAALAAIETLMTFDDARMLDVDKSWHALERLYKAAHAPSPISDGRLPDAESATASGESGDESEDSMSANSVHGLCTPARVKAITAAMGRITPSILRKGYDAKKFTREGIYPDIWGEGDVLDVYVMPYDAELRAFYAAAADAGEAIVWQLN